MSDTTPGHDPAEGSAGRSILVQGIEEGCTPAPVGQAPHVVIVGAGFGGLSCAKALGGSNLRVTIVDQRN